MSENIKIPSFFWDNTHGDRTKETLIDFNLSWTLRWAKSDLKKVDNKVQRLAEKILLTFINGESCKPYNVEHICEVKEVKTWKQWKRIDLIAHVDIIIDREEKNYALIFENKVYSSVHDDQLKRYKDIVCEYYKDRYNDKKYEPIYIFLTRHNQVPQYDITECKNNKFKYWPLRTIQNSLIEEEEREGEISKFLTGNALFDEFWFNY